MDREAATDAAVAAAGDVNLGALEVGTRHNAESSSTIEATTSENPKRQ